MDEWIQLLEEAREIRRREADWAYIERLPPRLRAALRYYVKTGDFRTAARLAGLGVEEFLERAREARIPLVI
ncbi:paREP6 [Thermoproteus uzoniensis 768-20]|uniref:PaREP6 n=1 Tax=Thermoproteus uzoniensis (strain 768-20) TaxID=999630 RepID=F2L0Q8_THEU7|nr:hypothetical protein [Thermoproteus uzoniensis]AEA12723.1 paREP6 [Thermoproteus uzoniensis 768-20]